MNVFFATRHKTECKTRFFGSNPVTIELKEAAFVRDNGEVTLMRPSNNRFVQSETEILQLQLRKGERMYGYNCAESFVALNSDGDVPIDLAQSVIEYMELLNDSEFGLGTDYLHAIDTPDGRYTPEQKVAMFMTHRDAPDLKEFTCVQDEALWVWKFYHFFEQHKRVTILSLKLGSNAIYNSEEQPEA